MSGRISTSTLLACGIAGPVIFIAVFLLEGLTRSGYDPMRQYVSLLSLGDGGWLQVANFVVTGVLIVAAGVGLGRSWSELGRWVPRLVALVGIALVWAGVFVTDPAQGYPGGAPAGLPTDASWHAGLHYLGALVVFVGLPVAMVVAARSSAMREAMPGWSIYCLTSAGLMFGLWIATFLVAGPNGVSQVAGLLQRIAIVAGFQWLVGISAIELSRLRKAALPVHAAT